MPFYSKEIHGQTDCIVTSNYRYLVNFIPILKNLEKPPHLYVRYCPVFVNPNARTMLLSPLMYTHEPKYKLPTVSINKEGNGNCVKSRKFIANRTNEYFILTCITSGRQIDENA